MKKESTSGMNKFGVAAALQEIGQLLRLNAGDQYRSRAYAKAAFRAVGALPSSGSAGVSV